MVFLFKKKKYMYTYSQRMWENIKSMRNDLFSVQIVIKDVSIIHINISWLNNNDNRYILHLTVRRYYLELQNFAALSG